MQTAMDFAKSAPKEGDDEAKGYESKAVPAAPQAIEDTRKVTVLKLSGAIAFGPQEVSKDMKIKDLKAMFDPKKPKDLTNGGDILGDNTTLDSLPKEVSLFASYTQAGAEELAMLTSVNPAERKRACEDLGEVAEPGDKVVVASLIKMVDDKYSYARVAACLALAKVANKGDQETLATLATMLKDTEANVRSAACQALAKVAGREDLLKMLSHEVWQTREFACETLGKVAPEGDEHAIDELGKLLKDSDNDLTTTWQVVEGQRLVRAAAATALSKVAFQGNEEVVKSLEMMKIVCLEDRFARDKAVAKVVGDDVPKLMEMLKHEDLYIRRAGCFVLGKVALQGDAAVIRSIEMMENPWLGDQYEYLEEARNEALAKVRGY